MKGMSMSQGHEIEKGLKKAQAAGKPDMDAMNETLGNPRLTDEKAPAQRQANPQKMAKSYAAEEYKRRMPLGPRARSLVKPVK